MLGVLASLAVAGTGIFAIVAICSTVEAQAPAVAKLLRDSRSIAREREFLIRVTGQAGALSPFAATKSGFARLRRLPHRAVRLRRPAEVKAAQLSAAA